MSITAATIAKQGSTLEDFPTLNADSGSVTLRAEENESRRGYFQFASPYVKSFFLARVLLRMNSRGDRSHRILLHAITNDDLNLFDVTWNTQDDLDYEAIPGVNPIYAYDNAAGLGTITDDWLMREILIPLQDPAYKLASGKTMYGMRLMVEDDTDYAGSERLNQVANITMNVYNVCEAD